MRYVYLFHEGNARMKALGGNEGQPLREMTKHRPAGFPAA